MTMAPARIAALTIAALAAAALMPARATAAKSEAEREAKAHFQAGETHFKAGEFDEALKEYQAGYEAKPLPGFLVNIAQCQRRLGDLKAARASYQKFVLVAPDSPLVPKVRSMIAEIDGLLANAEGEKPAAEPDAEAKPAPPPEPPAPPPALERETSAAVLVAKAPEPEPAPAPRRRWWLWGALGAVVVGGAVTAVVLMTGGTTTISDGSLGTLRR
jgi:tetratricopeptide (TPR) repeat protein